MSKLVPDMAKHSAALIFFIALIFQIGHGQDPHRFDSEIDRFRSETPKIVSENDSTTSGPILFTGSSSVRFWNSLSKDFPSRRIINRGFGGSETSDLLYFADDIIFSINPSKIFIYEGDNDISSGKSPDNILRTMKRLVAKIKEQLPNTPIYFISPKSSIARWNLKEQYEQLNYQLELWMMWEEDLTYIDVWEPMLAPDGNIMQDIFIGDGLHMNEKGYDIWRNVIYEYLKN